MKNEQAQAEAAAEEEEKVSSLDCVKEFSMENGRVRWNFRSGECCAMLACVF